MGIVFGIIGIITLRSRKKTPVVDSEEVSISSTQEPLVEEEPDEQIVVSPTRINESTGSIFVYRSKCILIYSGIRIPMDSISDVSFNNVALIHKDNKSGGIPEFSYLRICYENVQWNRASRLHAGLDHRVEG